MQRVLDLNADVGEVDDPSMLETGVLGFVTSANIATGGHAGNLSVMDAAVREAARLGIRIGAHPSYPDREGFGRRVIAISLEALRAELLKQVGALDTIARDHGLRVEHVKPHGALYHQATIDEGCARLLAEVVSCFESAVLVAPAGSAALSARWSGVRTLAEAFADRGYRRDGGLIARGDEGDLITEPERAAEQALSIAVDGRVRAGDGWLSLHAGTICVHGDTPGASDIGRAVRRALEGAGVLVRATP
jgi:5-oxoprolinase (ATP-hydrolysing) subunit A